jgi:DNA-binding CsgD family transcriptional regulator
VACRQAGGRALAAAGLSHTEIAGRLHISPHAAKAHAGRLLYHLDARGSVQPVIVACS